MKVGVTYTFDMILVIESESTKSTAQWTKQEYGVEVGMGEVGVGAPGKSGWWWWTGLPEWVRAGVGGGVYLLTLGWCQREVVSSRWKRRPLIRSTAYNISYPVIVLKCRDLRSGAPRTNLSYPSYTTLLLPLCHLTSTSLCLAIASPSWVLAIAWGKAGLTKLSLGTVGVTWSGI